VLSNHSLTLARFALSESRFLEKIHVEFAMVLLLCLQPKREGSRDKLNADYERMSMTRLSTQRHASTRTAILEIARGVLEAESRSIRTLANSLGASFGEAVERLLLTTGKVVLSGVGKSGHIAQKIASTFSSTGTPACFLHPTEASHGDLGFLSPTDVLILLSNSGETQELHHLLAYATQLGLTSILVTSRPESRLARLSERVLILPSLSEACPMGLAPTTSTAMMLALGDALAAALLHLRSFEPEDYRERHPGGALGRNLRTVADVIRPVDEVPCLSPGASFQEALFTMAYSRLDCVLVGKSPETASVLCLHTLSPSTPPQSLLEELPLKPLVSVFHLAFIKEAQELMHQKAVRLVKVLDAEQTLLGFMHAQDCEL
jgi:arabinose-5-phosphate isomerase